MDSDTPVSVGGHEQFSDPAVQLIRERRSASKASMRESTSVYSREGGGTRACGYHSALQWERLLAPPPAPTPFPFPPTVNPAGLPPRACFASIEADPGFGPSDRPEPGSAHLPDAAAWRIDCGGRAQPSVRSAGNLPNCAADVSQRCRTCGRLTKPTNQKRSRSGPSAEVFAFKPRNFKCSKKLLAPGTGPASIHGEATPRWPWFLAR